METNSNPYAAGIPGPRIEAAMHLAQVISKSGIIGSGAPTAAEAIKGFDFDHTLSDPLSVAGDSALIDGDDQHPYIAKTVGHETSEVARGAASLSFWQQITDPAVRPNRLRARNIARPGHPMDDTTTLQLEFCLDVMLAADWFIHGLFRDPVPNFSFEGDTIDGGAVTSAARHYLQGCSFALAARATFHAKTAVALASPAVYFTSRDALAVQEVAAAAGTWSVNPKAPIDLQGLAQAADAAGIEMRVAVVSAAKVNEQGQATGSLPMALVTIEPEGRPPMTICTHGHTIRMIAAAAWFRGGAWSHNGGEPAAAPEKPAAQTMLKDGAPDPCDIPDVFPLEGPIGGSGFLGGEFRESGFAGQLGICLAMGNAARSTMHTATRAAIRARLPWLDAHLPDTAARVRALPGSIMEERMADDLRMGGDTSYQQLAQMAAIAAGIHISPA